MSQSKIINRGITRYINVDDKQAGIVSVITVELQFASIPSFSGSRQHDNLSDYEIKQLPSKPKHRTLVEHRSTDSGHNI